jgi:hypothetical protein
LLDKAQIKITIIIKKENFFNELVLEENSNNLEKAAQANGYNGIKAREIIRGASPIALGNQKPRIKSIYIVKT